MAEQGAPGFGGLLRQLRADVGLTQEELAGAAGLSPRSISDLERGINLTARKDTARLLADALNLAGPQRALFEAAARGRATAAAVLAAHGPLITRPNNLPVQLTSFVGREDDIAGVRQAVAAARLVTLTGAGGIGKTRLALQAAAGLQVINPLRQARRFDPAGDYVRRYVPELAGLDPARIHTPWRLDAGHRQRLGYPDPLTDPQARSRPGP